MNLFNSLFKSNNQNVNSNRIDLSNEDQLNEIIILSVNEPVYIFKHSKRCGTSYMVLKRFESKIAELQKSFYLLDIIKYRALSNLIVDKFQVRHESPQLLVVKDKKLIASGSHSGVLNIEI